MAVIKRFFAFGCSLTSYSYLTWADLIGVNFDEYYNYGLAGASNTYIMNRLVEADDKFKFNPTTDLVIVMLTGIGRFSYMDKDQWITNGDLHSFYSNTKHFNTGKLLDVIWNEAWFVYQSWVAAKVIKNLLLSKNISHKILMGVDNRAYLNNPVDIESKQIRYVQEIYNLLDFKKSLYEWREESQENQDSPFWEDKNHEDGHPSPRAYLKFIKEHFPDLISDKSIEILNQYEHNFDHSSQQNQGRWHEKFFQSKYITSFQNPLFGRI